MSLSLRPYQHPQDYPETLRLWQNAGEGINLGASDTLEEIAKKVQRDPDLFLLAEAEGHIIGSVIGGFDGRRGLIYHLAVDPAWRQQGIATRLMDEVESRLRAKGCRKAYLLILNGNSVAELYRKRGWKSMQPRVEIFGKDL